MTTYKEYIIKEMNGGSGDGDKLYYIYRLSLKRKMGRIFSILRMYVNFKLKKNNGFFFCVSSLILPIRVQNNTTYIYVGTYIYWNLIVNLGFA